MHCPFCKNPESRVIDSRTADDGIAIRRRRSCTECGRRFTTQETVILMVSKRSGVTEPFTREKIIRGVRRACQGRPVGEDQLAILAQRVEDTIRARGCAEIASHEVGLAILGPLRELDEVAYLRFASVYRGFDSLADFEDEIALLRAAHANVGQPQQIGPDMDLSSGALDEAPARARGTANDTANDTVNDTVNDAMNDAMSDTARDAARQTPRDEARQTPRDGARQAPRDAANDTPRDTPNEAVRDTAKDASSQTVSRRELGAEMAARVP